VTATPYDGRYPITLILSPFVSVDEKSRDPVLYGPARGFPGNVPRMSKILSLCARSPGVSDSSATQVDASDGQVVNFRIINQM
jgi:hypothetical protein